MRFVKLFGRFRRQREGSVAILGALLFSVAAGAAVFAIDHVTVQGEKAKLQRAVDQAALTTVRGLHFTKVGTVARTKDSDGGDTDSALSSIAEAVVRSNLDQKILLLTTDAKRSEMDSVLVEATLTIDTPFGALTGLSGTKLTASAEAQLYGARNICVMALGEGQQVGVNLEQSAHIKAGDCGIYSNSPSISSVNIIDEGRIDSSFVCAAGGYTGLNSAVSSSVVTDCPQVTDPLAARPLPPLPTICDHNMLVFKDQEIATLQPGHYCGGLIIEGEAQVTFEPGIYQISGGMLLAQGNTSLRGEEVAIIMNDQNGSIFFNDAARVDLSAPTTGLMAGIVIASRSVCEGEDCHYRVFEIKSSRVSSLLGTIYIPEDRFIINTSMTISEEAAFTIILARFVQGQKAPTLVLNTDYEATDVPVPDGFIGSKGSRLTR